MLILEYILKAYLIIGGSIIIHELGHLLIVLLIKINYYKVFIGSRLFIVNTKRLAFSLIWVSGSIKMDLDELKTKKKYQIILLFLLGPISSLVLLYLSFYINNSILKVMAASYNGVSFFINIMPIIPGSDMNHMMKCLKNIQD